MKPKPNQPPTQGEILLTIFLKHDQSQNVDQIQGTLAEREWWDRFPPEGTTVVSWTVAMGLGQIVTLRLPAEKLGMVNLELERSAWGVFATECYVTYDFVPVRERIKKRYHEGEWGSGKKARKG
ncbi:MAG: hypothetical protein EXR28_07695 [Betaproteobacteria bacterium]|nr:hypothetical protein [Betaproteobacteria bacterium]